MIKSVPIGSIPGPIRMHLVYWTKMVDLCEILSKNVCFHDLISTEDFHFIENLR